MQLPAYRIKIAVSGLDRVPLCIHSYILAHLSILCSTRQGSVQDWHSPGIWS